MKKQQAPKNRKFVLMGVVILAILTIVGLSIIATIAVQQSRGALDQNKTTVLNMQGEVTCLPHKDTSGPVTEECAFGLKVGDGTYYGLSDLDVADGTQPIDTGSTVLVSGTLIPPVVSEKYDIAGTIQVYALKLRD